jgi:hypothetical protein
MPNGKPAGVRCVQLLADYRCALFGKPERPGVCVSLRPHESMCGAEREAAMRILGDLELATAPVRERVVGLETGATNANPGFSAGGIGEEVPEG